mmetsp:Transcript_41091/g.132648  ORF Transcript_41091/g.132648 Transcript_41091/m.132648 type:complete len:277 (-) Transcript_41091:294-1124(-)
MSPPSRPTSSSRLPMSPRRSRSCSLSPRTSTRARASCSPPSRRTRPPHPPPPPPPPPLSPPPPPPPPRPSRPSRHPPQSAPPQSSTRRCTPHSTPLHRPGRSRRPTSRRRAATAPRPPPPPLRSRATQRCPSHGRRCRISSPGSRRRRRVCRGARGGRRRLRRPARRRPSRACSCFLRWRRTAPPAPRAAHSRARTTTTPRRACPSRRCDRSPPAGVAHTLRRVARWSADASLVDGQPFRTCTLRKSTVPHRRSFAALSRGTRSSAPSLPPPPPPV